MGKGVADPIGNQHDGFGVLWNDFVAVADFAAWPMVNMMGPVINQHLLDAINVVTTYY
jgi:hypothetical protein